MASRRITITFPEAELKELRKAVKRGGSVSAYVRLAVAHAIRDERLFNERIENILMETGGPVTPEEAAWIDALATSGGRRKTPRKRTAA